MTPDAGAVLARWRLVRVLGEGAQSRVFLAHDTTTSQLLALKVSPWAVAVDEPAEAAARADYLASAQRLKHLAHEAIVQVFDAGIDDGWAWLAMEAMPGSDLSRCTQATRLLPARQVLDIGAQVAAALAHTHRLGVVHRDLKPANVLVDWAAGRVKLADFCLARALGGSRNTGTGIVPGTPAYMAPELLAGAVPDAATDLYALGAMLFELLAGRHPHQATRMGELLRQVAQQPAPDVRQFRPDLPAGVAELLARLLAKNPRQRLADAAAVALALRQLQAGLLPM